MSPFKYSQGKYIIFILFLSSTHPSTLSSNKLVIFSLYTSPAASIIVLLLEVRVIFQLLWCLEETQTQKIVLIEIDS